MATYDYSKQTAGGPAQLSRSGMGDLLILRTRLDFTLAPDALAAADIVKFITIPGGYILRNAWLKIVTAATGTFTCDIRDSSAAATVTVVGKNLAAAAGTIYGADGSAFVTAGNVVTLGKVYTVADYIAMTLTGANAGKFGVYEVCAELVRA